MKKFLRISLAVLLAAVFILPARASAFVFEDVPKDHWAAGDIQYVTERKLFNGVSSGRFDPSGTLDRAMLATVLYRYAGSPQVSGPSPYTDIPEGRWYTPGVIWAYENRIFPTNIMGASQLDAAQDVRRAEFCIMLYNFARTMGKSVPDNTAPLAPNSFTDMEWLLFARMGCGSIYGEAETAMLRWALPLGIMRGASDTSLNPLGHITRAEAAAMLSRFDKTVLGGTEPPAEPDPPAPVESDPVPSASPQPAEPADPLEPEQPPQLLPVQLIRQNPELPNGCEATSLAILLSCTGTPADKMDVFYNYLPRQPLTWQDGVHYGPDPQTAFAGDAALKNGGWYCFENPVIQAGGTWLQERGLPWQIQNCTGLSQEELEQYLSQDTPMMVWATLKNQTPHTSGSPWTLPDGTKHYPYTNLHCFVLTGLSDDGRYTSADPIYGWRSFPPGAFWSVFDSMGRRAVTLVPAAG